MRILAVLLSLAGPVVAEQSGAEFFNACADAYLAAQAKAEGAELAQGDTVVLSIPKRFQLDGVLDFPIAMACPTLTEGKCNLSDDSNACMDQAGAKARDMVEALVRALPDEITGPNSARYQSDRGLVLNRDPATACPGPNCDLYAEAGLFIDWRRLRDMASAAQ